MKYNHKRVPYGSLKGINSTTAREIRHLVQTQDDELPIEVYNNNEIEASITLIFSEEFQLEQIKKQLLINKKYNKRIFQLIVYLVKGYTIQEISARYGSHPSNIKYVLEKLHPFKTKIL